eukprot:TRINITY_DN1171_c0_g1_i1.p1 TRINITY_DN1171_c0_g1~~TRINITY_DN1171_c0_g1_i1.p1  ORF type:complete len:425 (+),score=113.56 TRINITY_DN1171_c0_g1_i1:96-1277(+)
MAVRAGGDSLLFVLVTLSYIAWAITSCYHQLLPAAVPLRHYAPEFALLCMLLWCYVQAVRTPPGHVPDPWRDLPGGTAPLIPHSQRRRWCPKCSQWKPPRTHHCSVCKVCVLKYDHHCPWIANCVGYYNHKQFMLLVTYASAVCWCVICRGWHLFRECAGLSGTQVEGGVLTIAQAAARQGVTPRCPDAGLARANFLAMYVTVGCLGVLLTAFATQHHILALKNRTTVESLDKEDCCYDGGIWMNLVEVYGPRWWLWWAPVRAHPVSDEGGTVFKGTHSSRHVTKHSSSAYAPFSAIHEEDDPEAQGQLQEQLTRLLSLPPPQQAGAAAQPQCPGGCDCEDGSGRHCGSSGADCGQLPAHGCGPSHHSAFAAVAASPHCGQRHETHPVGGMQL